jgi:hypothetical protein
MSDKNVTDIAELENINISEEDLPEVISEQFKAIVEIDKRIAEAEISCVAAKETADKMILAKALNQKDAINATQDAVRSLAEAQTALTEAQRMLFENQQKMADGMRYLLVLGASSIAMNRVVIAELEAKLKQATKEQLSEKAREELIDVVRLLREQESAFSKQERMSKQISDTSKIVGAHERKLEEISQTDERQDKKNENQDVLIEIGATINREQDEKIYRQQKIDKIHDRKISKNAILSWVGISLASVALIIAIIGLFI